MKIDLVLATVFIAGFAIQQILQIVDPFVAGIPGQIKKIMPDKTLPGGVSDDSFKKSVMGCLAFVLGMFATALANLSLLQYVQADWRGTVGDILITALVIGSGTEGANTFLKYISYAKDGLKAGLPLEIKVSPSSLTGLCEGKYQFLATVDNCDDCSIVWSVVQQNGGKIDQTGCYTAPPTPGGPFQVIATSKEDPKKSAIAVVTVT